MSDIPTFAEITSIPIWPLWILLLAAIALWLLAEHMLRQIRHWHKLKRRAEIAYAESERQRRSLQ